MNERKVIEFYDDFIEEQAKSGINDRIYSLYKRMLKLGMKPDSNVLELGSGIGTLTYLLAGYITRGNIEAVDISPASIQFSSKRIKKKNIRFVTGNIVNHISEIKNIDFVTLYDVIEHIPYEEHNELFKNLYTICNEKTRILINIPNPDYIEYDMKNNPGELQIIDQPISLKFILENVEKNGLHLDFFETYSIWVENDYQFLILSKKKTFEEVLLSTKRSFLQKVLKKLKRIYIKQRYNYR